MQILVLFGILLVMALVSSVGAAIWNREHTEDACWYLSRAGEQKYSIHQLFTGIWMSVHCVNTRVFVQVTSPPTLRITCWRSSSCTTTWSPSACWSLWRWSSSLRPSSLTGYVFLSGTFSRLLIVSSQAFWLLFCFLPQDVEMYYSETDTPAMARTSNLNEELGQVSSSSCSCLLLAS